VAIDVLVALSVSIDGPWQVRQLARTLGVPNSTLRRIVLTLEAKGMVRRGEGGGYVLGDGVSRLGRPYRLTRLVNQAEPLLSELNRQTNESVNLALYQDDAMLIVKTLESPASLRTVSWEGRRDRLHASALGKAYLAALPQDELDVILARLPLTAETMRTIVTPASLRDELARTRTRGYAIDDEETLAGVRCVAAAIVGANGRVVGAVSVSAPSVRFPLEGTVGAGTAVRNAAAAISALAQDL
jgi:DNA-binding IclR family transcriptional regulator